MAYSKEHVRDYGNKSFDEIPFCDADAICLCEALYMPLEQVVGESFDDEPKTFSQAANELFALRGYKHSSVGLLISSGISRKMMTMAATKRYADIKITGIKARYCANPSLQFCGITMILPDGTSLIIYRGTDDTIAGWKEDLDFFLNKGTPSNQLSVDYINDVAKKYNGNIMVAGHSKGGNLALRAALKCSSEIRKRITAVYNFDGPGFPDYSIFNTVAYDEILPVYKHFIPYSSLIGVLMAHDYDYKACDNRMHFGAFQHNLGVWSIKDGELVVVDDTDFKSKLTDILVAEICSDVTDEVCEAVEDIMTTVTLGIEEEGLMGVAKHLFKSIGGAVKAAKAINPETNKIVLDYLKSSKGILKDTITLVREGNISKTTEMAYGILAD